MHCLGHYISALRWCCDLKFLHALEIDQGLLAHRQGGRGFPSPKKIKGEHLKFGLKFSVFEPITLGLVEVSSRNFSRRRVMTHETGVIT